MTPTTSGPSRAPELDVQLEADRLTLTLRGALTAARLQPVWTRALATLKEKPHRRLLVDVSAVEHVDGAGAALLVDLLRRARRAGIPAELSGANTQVHELLDLYEPEAFLQPPPPEPPQPSVPEEVGRSVAETWRDFYVQVAFIGELIVATLGALRHPTRLHWRDTLRVAERSFVDSLPIVMLLGFLIGLIMSFQAAIPMRQFGVELFVADLIALSMFRELGALITAVILAGRTGSAFAAEIGTMKVNEEINALQTLGLDPLRFLVVGRVLAGIVMTPILTLFAILAGMIGGLVVMLSLGFTFTTYVNEVQYILGLADLVGGLAKSVVFGLEIAAIGCMRGLQTGSGASAVGESATRAVVTSIIAIIVTDGIFSVVFYYLDF